MISYNEERRKHAADNDAADVRKENSSGRENAQDRGGESQPLDLDHDGMIGRTGGFYGGTSYLGNSNYGPDWNSAETGRTESESNRQEENTQQEDNNFEEGEQDETGELTDDDRII